MALKIDIKGQVSDLRAKIGQAASSVRRFGRLMRVVSWRAEKRWQKLGKTINKSLKESFGGIGAKAFGAVGGFLAIRQITSMARNLVDEMDRIGKASDRLGITAEAYQEMAFAAKLAGVSMERFTLAMSALGPFMLNAAKAGTRQAKVLEVLNLKYKDLAKLDPEAQFKAITKAIDGISNATERVGVSRLIFGRAGFEVLGMARNYETAVNKIRSAGGIISSEDIKAAEQFNDQLALMISRLKASSTKSGLLAWLNDIAKTISEEGLFDFSRPLSEGMLTGEGLGGSSEEAVAAAAGEKISKKMIDAARKTMEEGKLGESAAEAMAAGAEKVSGAVKKDQFRVDQLRRIGALPSAVTGGPRQPIVDVVEHWLPLVLEAAREINRKTPDVNQGGRY